MFNFKIINRIMFRKDFSVYYECFVFTIQQVAELQLLYQWKRYNSSVSLISSSMIISIF